MPPHIHEGTHTHNLILLGSDAEDNEYWGNLEFRPVSDTLSRRFLCLTPFEKIISNCSVRIDDVAYGVAARDLIADFLVGM